MRPPTDDVQAQPPQAQAWRDARVVVTGSAGFIGRHLCRALHACGAQLVLFQHKRRAVPWEGAHSITVNGTDRAAVQAALQQVKPDHVFHLAGFVSGDRSPHAMLRAFDGNVIMTANVLLTCLTQLPHTRVITTSSLEASNPLQGAAVTGSAYGVSKLMVEVLSGSLHKLYAAPVLTARLGMVYGPDDPNPCRVVPTIIRSFLAHGSPRLSSGRRRSDWVYIDDVIYALLALASMRELAQPALDLGSGELHSVREVAELIAFIMGATQPIQYDPSLDRPQEQERCADLPATLRALGACGATLPTTSLLAGLSRTVAWYRSRL